MLLIHLYTSFLYMYTILNNIVNKVYCINIMQTTLFQALLPPSFHYMPEELNLHKQITGLYHL